MEKVVDHINIGQCQLITKETAAKVKAKALKQLKTLKDSKLIEDKYIIIWSLLTPLLLDLTFNQKFKRLTILYMLLFYTVATNYAVLTDI